MRGPLVVLSLGAIFAGMALDNTFIGPDWHSFWGASIFNAPDNHVLADDGGDPRLGSRGTAGVCVARHCAGLIMYIAFPLLPMRLATMFRGIYLFLLNKWYFDELYDAIFVQPALRLAHALWQTGDATIIDGVPNGVAELAVMARIRR